MKSTLILFIVFFLTSVSGISQDIQSVQVNELSDQQIKQIVQEVQTRGLSMDQAIMIAKTRGASQVQIDQLRTRINQLSSTVPTQAATQLLQTGNAEKLPSDRAQKKELKISELNKRIFGHQLFNTKKLSFEPSVNIPTPRNYVLGIGDQIQINVWGASQQTYSLEIGNDGSIMIPDLGLIPLAGKEFSQAKTTITNRLKTIYSDMQGNNPKTFADVSLQNIRSININIIGEVIAPGTYKLPATASAFNALYLSGGPNENGSFRNIKLIRDGKNVKEIDVYDYLINGNSDQNFLLRDQDIIMIPPFEKRVELAGNFKRTGLFELIHEETLEQLLNYAGGFTEDAYKSVLGVTRYNNNQRQLIDVSEDNYSAFELVNGDSVFAGKIIDRYQNRVTIEGAVFRPGEYSLTEGLTLSKLIDKAEGIREDHYANRGLIVRLDEQLYPTTIAFDVNKVLNGNEDYPLKREDHIMIKDIFSMGETASLNISGEIMIPGEYKFTKNLTLKDLIFLAGGLKEAASQSHIEIARRNSHEFAASINNKMVTLFDFSIDRNLSLSKEDEEFILQPFDHVYVRKAPSYFKQKTVSIYGEVKYPGQYSISAKSERISDIIIRSGGLTPEAYVKGARLDRSIKPEMEQNLEIIKNMSESDSVILDNGKIEVNRLELKLEEIIKNPGTIYDYVLHEGDRIYIPKESEEIWVSGEVLNPIGQAWEQGRSLKYYINRAGGFSSNAKKGKVYIIYSDGTTKVTKSFLTRNYPKPMPGCQVVVPTKPPRPQGDNTGKWLGIASTLSSLAVAIAAVLR